MIQPFHEFSHLLPSHPPALGDLGLLFAPRQAISSVLVVTACYNECWQIYRAKMEKQLQEVTNYYVLSKALPLSFYVQEGPSENVIKSPNFTVLFHYQTN